MYNIDSLMYLEDKFKGSHDYVHMSVELCFHNWNREQK